MLRKSLFILACIFVISSTCAQSRNDKKIIDRTTWQTQELDNGILLKTALIPSLYGTSQCISIVEIDMNKGYKIGITEPKTGVAHTSKQAKEAEAIAAINGTFFSVQKQRTFFFLKEDHKILGKTIATEFAKRAAAVFAINDDGSCILTDWSKAKEEKEIKENKYKHAVVSGPLLVLDDKEAKIESNKFNDTRNPRTAIGITKENKLLLVVVDGRHISLAEGMDMYHLAHFMKSLGATAAMNLDGGGSSTMYIKGAPENGVVNKPCDNKKFDNNGEREVRSIIFVKK